MQQTSKRDAGRFLLVLLGAASLAAPRCSAPPPGGGKSGPAATSTPSEDGLKQRVAVATPVATPPAAPPPSGSDGAAVPDDMGQPVLVEEPEPEPEPEPKPEPEPEPEWVEEVPPAEHPELKPESVPAASAPVEPERKSPSKTTATPGSKPKRRAEREKEAGSEEVERAAREAAARRAAVAEQAASKGVLAMLGTTGSGKGGTVADVFASGTGGKSLDEAFAGVSGVSVATRSGGGRAGGGAGKPVPEPPKTVGIARYPGFEAPEEVQPGREFAAMVSLTEEELTPAARVSQGTKTAEGKLALELPDAPDRTEWRLTVVLSAPGFRIADGANKAEIVLPRKGDSTPAMFRLAAKPIETPQRKRTLHATLWHKALYLGRISRPILVVAEARPITSPMGGAAAPGAQLAPAQPAAEPPPPAEPKKAPAPRQTLGLALADDLKEPNLTVQLRTRDGEPGEAELTIVSPHLSPPVETYRIRLPKGLPGFLAQRYGRFAGAAARGASPPGAPAAPVDGKERRIAMLRGFGRLLYDKFAPKPFKEAVWLLKDHLGERFRSIQIVTDDPALPWELMRPRRDDDELDFLGIELSVARWHTGLGSRQLARPPQRARLQHVLAVAPDYKGADALPATKVEMEGMSTVEGFSRLPASFKAVQSAFRRWPSGILHFAGHGVVQEDAAGGWEYAIRLEDGVLDLMTWQGFETRRRTRFPVVFFNACDVGQAKRVAGFVDGWAPAVLDAGASGFIGGLWPLGDRGAAEFSRTFYGELSRRLGGGEAGVADILREARRRFYETGDPTYLAYVYYGDPHFRFASDD